MATLRHSSQCAMLPKPARHWPLASRNVLACVDGARSVRLGILASGRSMSTDAGREEEPNEDDIVADRQKNPNRQSKAGTLAEKKKTLKPWAGGAGGSSQSELYMEVGTENIKMLIINDSQ